MDNCCNQATPVVRTVAVVDPCPAPEFFCTDKGTCSQFGLCFSAIGLTCAASEMRKVGLTYCSVNTSLAVGSIIPIKFTVYDMLGSKAEATRLLTIGSPCPAGQYYCSGSCLPVTCALAALLGSRKTPPVISLSTGAKPVFDANATLWLEYGTAPAISLLPCTSAGSQQNCAVVGQDAQDGDLSASIQITAIEQCVTGEVNCFECDPSYLASGLCLPGAYLYQYTLTDSSGANAVPVALQVKIYEMGQTTGAVAFLTNASDTTAAHQAAAALAAMGSPDNVQLVAAMAKALTQWLKLQLPVYSGTDPVNNSPLQLPSGFSITEVAPQDVTVTAADSLAGPVEDVLGLAGRTASLHYGVNVTLRIVVRAGPYPTDSVGNLHARRKLLQHPHSAVNGQPGRQLQQTTGLFDWVSVLNTKLSVIGTAFSQVAQCNATSLELRLFHTTNSSTKVEGCATSGAAILLDQQLAGAVAGTAVPPLQVLSLSFLSEYQRTSPPVDGSNIVVGGILLNQIRRPTACGSKFDTLNGACSDLVLLPYSNTLVPGSAANQCPADMPEDMCPIKMRPYGIDPVFNPVSVMYDPRLAGLEDQYYNTSDGSGDYSPEKRPYGFQQRNMAAYPTGFPIVLTTRTSAARAQTLLQYLQYGRYLDASSLGMTAQVLTYNSDSRVFGYVRIDFYWGAQGSVQTKFEVDALPLLLISRTKVSPREVLITFVGCLMVVGYTAFVASIWIRRMRMNAAAAAGDSTGAAASSLPDGLSRQTLLFNTLVCLLQLVALALMLTYLGLQAKHLRPKVVYDIYDNEIDSRAHFFLAAKHDPPAAQQNTTTSQAGVIGMATAANVPRWQLDDDNTDLNAFSSMFSLVDRLRNLQVAYTSLQGIALLCLMFSAIQALTFQHKLGIVPRTLLRALTDLVNFFIVLLICLLGIAFAAHIAMGNRRDVYSNLASAIQTWAVAVLSRPLPQDPDTGSVMNTAEHISFSLFSYACPIFFLVMYAFVMSIINAHFIEESVYAEVDEATQAKTHLLTAYLLEKWQQLHEQAMSSRRIVLLLQPLAAKTATTAQPSARDVFEQIKKRALGPELLGLDDIRDCISMLAENGLLSIARSNSAGSSVSSRATDPNASGRWDADSTAGSDYMADLGGSSHGSLHEYDDEAYEADTVSLLRSQPSHRTHSSVASALKKSGSPQPAEEEALQHESRQPSHRKLANSFSKSRFAIPLQPTADLLEEGSGAHMAAPSTVQPTPLPSASDQAPSSAPAAPADDAVPQTPDSRSLSAVKEDQPDLAATAALQQPASLNIKFERLSKDGSGPSLSSRIPGPSWGPPRSSGSGASLTPRSGAASIPTSLAAAKEMLLTPRSAAGTASSSGGHGKVSSPFLAPPISIKPAVKRRPAAARSMHLDVTPSSPLADNTSPKSVSELRASLELPGTIRSPKASPETRPGPKLRAKLSATGVLKIPRQALPPLDASMERLAPVDQAPDPSINDFMAALQKMTAQRTNQGLKQGPAAATMLSPSASFGRRSQSPVPGEPAGKLGFADAAKQMASAAKLARLLRQASSPALNPAISRISSMSSGGSRRSSRVSYNSDQEAPLVPSISALHKKNSTIRATARMVRRLSSMANPQGAQYMQFMQEQGQGYGEGSPPYGAHSGGGYPGPGPSSSAGRGLKGKLSGDAAVMQLKAMYAAAMREIDVVVDLIMDHLALMRGLGVQLDDMLVQVQEMGDNLPQRFCAPSD
ncbi:hypothetical protein WJX72_002981 [[Myrmecia] bisecta]|uniref:Polycystin cation channel PKD1/PKD2 domain-containing protein n=1 Tax=[Myrmecia] bisecta TaxID=41462 RepID=A0AAW1Q3P0_9CHLO